MDVGQKMRAAFHLLLPTPKYREGTFIRPVGRYEWSSNN